MPSIVGEKSEKFALRIIELYKYLREEKHEYIMSKQVMRSGTSVGANLAESEYAQSNADFVSKLSVALKEANETSYWLRLLKHSGYVSEEQIKFLESECLEIIKMLIASIKKCKLK